MNFYALTKHGLVMVHTTLCTNHFDARWIDELVTADHDGDWRDVSQWPTVMCQICGERPAPQCTDYYVCGNIKVPKK